MSSLRIFFAVWAIALLIFGLALVFRRSMFAFEIRITDSKAFLRHGRPRGSFLIDVQEIATRNGIVRGKVRGVGTGRSIRLAFVGPLPEDAKQQMRNAWGVLR